MLGKLRFDKPTVIDNVTEVDGNLIDPILVHPSKRAIRA
jgi:hypothetical protein